MGKKTFCTINKGAGPCGQSFCNMNDLHKYAKYKNMIRNLKSKHDYLINTKKKRDGALKFIKTIRTKIFEKIAWQKDADLNYDGIAGMIKEAGERIFSGKKKNFKNNYYSQMEDVTDNIFKKFCKNYAWLK